VSGPRSGEAHEPLDQRRDLHGGLEAPFLGQFRPRRASRPRTFCERRFNRISFGHSELSGARMWETAAEEGERAAQQALEIT
jgi:hypothetical protein